MGKLKDWHFFKPTLCPEEFSCLDEGDEAFSDMFQDYLKELQISTKKKTTKKIVTNFD